MENWGLITYRLTSLLYDKHKSSDSNKQWVAVVVAHELAHQVCKLLKKKCMWECSEKHWKIWWLSRSLSFFRCWLFFLVLFYYFCLCSGLCSWKLFLFSVLTVSFFACVFFLCLSACILNEKIQTGIKIKITANYL